MDDTSQLDRIYNKAVARKAIFETFEKNVILAIFFKDLDLVVFRDSFVQAISHLLFTVGEWNTTASKNAYQSCASQGYFWNFRKKNVILAIFEVSDLVLFRDGFVQAIS